MGRSLRAFVPAMICAAAIWIVGGLRETPSNLPDIGLDKVAHFGMYGVLGWLVGLGWVRIGRHRMGLVALVFALLLGIGDEWRQSRMTERSAEAADYAADVTGVAIGFFLAVRWRAARVQRNG